MSESQSRYSIVERLTNKKLSFLDENARIEEEIERKKQDLISYEKEFVSLEKEELNDLEKNKLSREATLEKLRAEIEFLENSKDSKIKTIAIKLNEIDRALEKLEAISKASE